MRAASTPFTGWFRSGAGYRLRDCDVSDFETLDDKPGFVLRRR